MLGGNIRFRPDPILEIAKEGAALKERGASQTQIHAFLEENGWRNIKFREDDKSGPGIPPKT